MLMLVNSSRNQVEMWYGRLYDYNNKHSINNNNNNVAVTRVANMNCGTETSTNVHLFTIAKHMGGMAEEGDIME